MLSLNSAQRVTLSVFNKKASISTNKKLMSTNSNLSSQPFSLIGTFTYTDEIGEKPLQYYTVNVYGLNSQSEPVSGANLILSSEVGNTSDGSFQIDNIDGAFPFYSFGILFSSIIYDALTFPDNWDGASAFSPSQPFTVFGPINNTNGVTVSLGTHVYDGSFPSSTLGPFFREVASIMADVRDGFKFLQQRKLG